ncbi:hypothetical protein B7H23_09155 [Notoacmeibacter marinus]|uniref:DUF1289 domain-containing protein n=1 Tax=Notoacmeibacter marinus TaxID=1876515 RepID=A0A231UWS8_9HYPH|nr:DUF1289 domain-containing protein [Notoacmeibacter marinus]OXT00307.1 hypothetical protein B7H23_09155 [Notoacmeibacter marinus]
MNPAPLSPCNRICTVDEISNLCVGCGRTRSEIATWGGMDDRTRRGIMAELPSRMARAGIAMNEGPRREDSAGKC